MKLSGKAVNAMTYEEYMALSREDQLRAAINDLSAIASLQEPVQLPGAGYSAQADADLDRAALDDDQVRSTASKQVRKAGSYALRSRGGKQASASVLETVARKTKTSKNLVQRVIRVYKNETGERAG